MIRFNNNTYNILAVVPARSGSKGVKNKNIKKINKKTLLDYTFERSIKSKGTFFKWEFILGRS